MFLNKLLNGFSVVLRKKCNDVIQSVVSIWLYTHIQYQDPTVRDCKVSLHFTCLKLIPGCMGVIQQSHLGFLQDVTRCQELSNSA